MAKKFRFMLVACLSMIVLAGCSGDKKETATKKEDASDKIVENGILKVATSGTLYPTSFHDQETSELTGYEVEVVKELAKRLDLEVNFEEMGIDGMFSAVNSGQVDMAANDIDITESRKEKFDFSTPHKYSYGSMIVREDDLSGIHKMEDLKGKKSAGGATTIYMQISEGFGAEPIIYDNVTNDQYLMDVGNGRTDVVLNDFYLQSMAVKAFPDLGVKIHPDLFYNPTSAGLVIKKGNTNLLEKVNDTLAEMEKDGTLKELSEKFFGGADVSVEPDVEITADVKVD
ncbi:transporter substrate-binding domain-containing protein [Isobaculum melis]|uniref:Amino acid ABC transporter substrate-binding protein, PAAT family n=1 Tax=Isobaculum melis TaxID=142588 RepID=A0A1H9S7K5_9LACT|nr:transporter substrate-binding domain-containing protein [Isobaculum melis]SER81016.1 amino acid ABC transporter substrate-binding protein, PAAT family [Isobaculum melis]